MGRSSVQNEPLEVTLNLTNVFEKLGIPYLIAGSLASGLDRLECGLDQLAVRFPRLAKAVTPSMALTV
jgi:hypothetical protein